MITIEKIRAPLFPKLYDAFLFDDDPLSDEDHWRKVFDYQFESCEDYCGNAMLDDGVVVGMMGMVFSERIINGVTKRFCNLHTWWVREDYRGRSLLMLRPILKLEGYTITHFTPCDTIRAITKTKLGFQDLNSQLKILLPSTGKQSHEPCLTSQSEAIQEQLNERDRRIMLDHQPYGCHNLLITDGDEQCYLLYTHVIRHRIPYCHIHYLSNKAVFAEKEELIRKWLLKHHKARFVGIDVRLVEELSFPRSFNFWAPAHAVYKPLDVAPADVDNLYSDVVFLSLTTLPDMTDRLRILARSMWPFGSRRAN